MHYLIPCDTDKASNKRTNHSKIYYVTTSLLTIAVVKDCNYHKTLNDFHIRYYTSNCMNKEETEHEPYQNFSSFPRSHKLTSTPHDLHIRKFNPFLSLD